ncbi:hypothetical protein [Xanthobacter sediminis]
MDRASYLTSLIGRPWSSEQSCWHLAREVERELFGRDLPDADVPDHPSWRWMIGAFSGHPEWTRWSELPAGAGCIVTAADGALVLMARASHPAHIGVWLRPEGGVLHTDPVAGVALEGLAKLRARGWARLRFFEPA